MFSMNSKNFLDSWLVSGDSLENQEFWKTLARPMSSIVFSQEFMENLGLANVFHEFKEFPRFLAGLMISLENQEFMENIGQANVFHEFP